MDIVCRHNIFTRIFFGIAVKIKPAVRREAEYACLAWKHAGEEKRKSVKTWPRYFTKI